MPKSSLHRQRETGENIRASGQSAEDPPITPEDRHRGFIFRTNRPPGTTGKNGVMHEVIPIEDSSRS